MKNHIAIKMLVGAIFAISWAQVNAFTFNTENVQGSFDSTISAGAGFRTKNPTCGLVQRGSTGAGVPEGCAASLSGLTDQGNINYGKGDPFTAYLKGSHELLLKLPESFKFMARVSWLKDFAAANTTGNVSAVNPVGVGSLTSDAHDDLSFKARLLDFWVSKEFAIDDQSARVRVGNQVISWGESMYIPGGINQTNSMDYMRLAQPGTQLKEVFLPAPIASFATGLGHGFNIEAYVQSNWNGSYLPPNGSYWSTVWGLGKGNLEYGINDIDAKNGNQFGAALRWQPDGIPLNVGLYAMSYNDKSPNFSYNANGSGQMAFVHLEDRKMFGVSANFPIGDWAIGTELSYRPKDAVSLNPAGGCGGNNGDCYVDEKKFQFHLTGMLSMTPSDYGGILKALGGAQTATFVIEAVGVRYPHLKKFYNGDPIGAGAWGWGFETSNAGPIKAVGDKNSWGYNLDFSWVYDGTLIPGWQVIPEVYYFQAVKGRTPNFMAQFMEGAQSANFVVTFVKNPAKFQFGVNYAKFWGGSSVLDQPLKDRDFAGIYGSYNF
ncbi:MAG: DUF1302 domain-containing protein [Dechloromonas sp.]|uniref:DUF1302 domain-containing protein n=1 Tax=Dechloromonas sp. TaxID=1917218 RepID=UPI0027F2722B|nr:DUF1302 domain-containing protein [Dechloromonas sp.]MBT9519983.1 DUF1302 domain-containing protein [Dechloromonas sp.]